MKALKYSMKRKQKIHDFSEKLAKEDILAMDISQEEKTHLLTELNKRYANLPRQKSKREKRRAPKIFGRPIEGSIL
jgi:hypothetical protein